MQNFIIPLLYLILSNGVLVVISKKTFGKCLPITMMLSAFSYFFSQIIFKTFKIGLILNILWACSFIFIILYKWLYKKDLKDLKESFLSKGFYVFLIIYIFVYFFDFKSSFIGWDEFSHWGKMVKEMLRLDKFYIVPESTLVIHKDYPPIMQLLELFFIQISGGYSEATLLKTMHLFTFSLVLPCIPENKAKKSNNIIITILLVISIVSLILLFDLHGIFKTIYLDYLISFLTVYLLFQIIIEKEPFSLFNLFSILIGGCFLILTKQIGICLFAMAIFLFFLRVITLKDKINIKKIIIALLLLIVLPLSLWLGWNNFVNNSNVSQQFELSAIKLNELSNVIKGHPKYNWQYTTFINYKNAIFNFNLIDSNFISLNYLQIIILSLFLLYIIGQFGKEYFKNKEIPISIITLFIGAIGYALVMLILYIFSFGEIEGPNLASYNRYMVTYLLICIIFAFSLFIYINLQKEDHSLKNLVLLTIILILIQSPENLINFKPHLLKSTETIYEHHANMLNETEENSNIFIISQFDSDANALAMQYYIQYYLDTQKINFSYYNFPTNLTDFKDYYNNIKNYLLNYDYLYLANINDNFKNDYGFLFENKDIKQEQLYKIINDNGNLKFELV